MANGAPQRNEDPFEFNRTGMTAVFAICRVWATSIEVFIHKGMGRRYNGLQAATVLLLVPFYMVGWQGYDLRPLMWFLISYIVMCMVMRVDGIMRRVRGEHCHSYYTGHPRLMGPNCKISEITFKRIVEPILVASLGFAMRAVNQPLGTYLMIGAGCMFISVSVDVMTDQARAEDMADAVIEQEYTAERFRGMRGR